MILKLIKYTSRLDGEDNIYVSSDKIYTMEEIYELDKKTASFKFSHTAIDLGFDEYVIKVRNPAEEIIKLIKGKK